MLRRTDEVLAERHVQLRQGVSEAGRQLFVRIDALPSEGLGLGQYLPVAINYWPRNHPVAGSFPLVSGVQNRTGRAGRFREKRARRQGSARELKCSRAGQEEDESRRQANRVDRQAL